MNCSKENTSCGSLPVPPKEGLGNLQAMVDWYVKYRKKHLFSGMNRFKTPYDMIAGAPGNPKRLESKIGPEVVKYHKGSHQRRLSNVVINKVHDTYEGKVEVCDFSDFDEYVDFVRTLKVKGYADNCIYDFCLISGYQKGLKPEKKVYIHTGPERAFDALVKMGLIDTEIEAGRIDHSALPEEIRVLESPYAEDFLCVFHSHLEKLANRD